MCQGKEIACGCSAQGEKEPQQVGQGSGQVRSLGSILQPQKSLHMGWEGTGI